eukprot:9272-Heterococcus_DN1.PRE.2
MLLDTPRYVWLVREIAIKTGPQKPNSNSSELITGTLQLLRNEAVLAGSSTAINVYTQTYTTILVLASKPVSGCLPWGGALAAASNESAKQRQ